MSARTRHVKLLPFAGGYTTVWTTGRIYGTPSVTVNDHKHVLKLPSFSERGLAMV